MTRRLDSIFTNRIVGLPIFLGLMYLVFYVSFRLGEFPMRWMEMLVVRLGNSLNGLWPAGSESDLRSLLVDGIIGGVGNVLVFLPNVLLLFLGIAILEESGYTARAALLMDRLMQKVGLHGTSFMPMLVGLGCTVPAMVAARSIESRRARLATLMILPLISCGGRLPLYALIIPAFFPRFLYTPVLWSIYVIGIVLAVVVAKVLSVTVLKGEREPAALSLPPYRLPTLRRLNGYMWERGLLYLRKAGTFILAISVLLWAVTTYPKVQSYEKDYPMLVRDAARDYGEGSKRIDARLGLRPGVGLSETSLEPAAWVRGDNGPSAATRAEPPDADAAVLARFHEYCHAIENARRDSPSAAERDAALARLEKDDPKVYHAVIDYMDTVKGPFETRMAALSGEKHAEELSHSIAGRFGRTVLEPVLKPLGFDWKIGTALLGAVAGKELVVAQLGIVNAVGTSGEKSTALRERLRRNYSPLVGFCIMLWCLIATPCAPTVAVMRHECGSWKWTLAQFGGLTLLAYVLTMIVYQAGSFFRVGV